MKIFVSIFILPVLFIACTRPGIRTPEATITGTKHGEDVTLTKADEGSRFTVPAGTIFTMEKTEALIDPETTRVIQPRRELHTWTFTKETEFESYARTLLANTGRINTDVALEDLAMQERKPLLYASIGCLLGVAFFVWRGYPTGVWLSAAASIILFLAWKVAGLPDWFWILAVVAICVAAGIYFGYERKEQETKTP